MSAVPNMEKAPEEQEHHPNVLRGEDFRQKRAQFKGIRLRKWGRWGSEILVLKSRANIWLGSYETAEQAARAYDAAAYCLRGPNTEFNFPDSIPSIPSAFSLSRREIQIAAAKYAQDELPSTSPYTHNNNNGVSLASPSRSSKISEKELCSKREQISLERGASQVRQQWMPQLSEFPVRSRHLRHLLAPWTSLGLGRRRRSYGTSRIAAFVNMDGTCKSISNIKIPEAG